MFTNALEFTSLEKRVSNYFHFILNDSYDFMILYWQHLLVLGYHQRLEEENETSVNTQLPPADDGEWFSENFGTYMSVEDQYQILFE